MAAAQPKSDQMRIVLCKVSDSTCALQTHHLFLRRFTRSPVCLSTNQRRTIQQKHTNESLHKHVVQKISHVRQAQIMFVITVHWLPSLLREIRLLTPNTNTCILPHTHTHTHTPRHWWLPSHTSRVHDINIKALVLHFLGIFPTEINQKTW